MCTSPTWRGSRDQQPLSSRSTRLTRGRSRRISSCCCVAKETSVSAIELTRSWSPVGKGWLVGQEASGAEDGAGGRPRRQDEHGRHLPDGHHAERLHPHPVSTHTHRHTHTRTHTHAHTHTHRHTHKAPCRASPSPPCEHAHTLTHTHTRTHTHTHKAPCPVSPYPPCDQARTHTHTRTCTHAHRDSCTHSHTLTHTHTCTHAHTHAHTHTHTHSLTHKHRHTQGPNISSTPAPPSPVVPLHNDPVHTRTHTYARTHTYTSRALSRLQNDLVRTAVQFQGFTIMKRLSSNVRSRD